MECSDVIIFRIISSAIIPLLSSKHYVGQQESRKRAAEREKDEEGEGSWGRKQESQAAEVPR